MHDCEWRENSSPIFSWNATWKWAIMVNQMILPLARLLDNGTIWACKCRSQGSTLSRLTGCQHNALNGAHCVAKHCSVLDYFQCRFLPVRLKLPPPPFISCFIIKPLYHNCTTRGYVTMQIKNRGCPLSLDFFDGCHALVPKH